MEFEDYIKEGMMNLIVYITKDFKHENTYAVSEMVDHKVKCITEEGNKVTGVYKLTPTEQS